MRHLNLIILVFWSTLILSQTFLPLGTDQLIFSEMKAGNENVWSSVHNPSVLTKDSVKFRIGVSAGNHYFTKELNAIGFVSDIQIGRGRLGIGLSSFGWRLFSENSVFISYGINLFKGFGLGGGLQYTFLILGPEKDLRHGISPFLGISYQIQNKVRFGLSVRNPFALNWIRSKEKFPISINIASEVFLGKSFSLLVGLHKSLNAPMNLGIGFQYRFKSVFKTSLGISLLNLGIGIGLNYRIKRFSFGLAFRYVNRLGGVSLLDFEYAH